MDPAVSVEQFAIELKKQVDRFVEHWNAHVKKKAPHYPATLPENEWPEQFEAFVETTP